MAGHRKRARKDCGRKRSRGQKRRGKRARALTPAERRRRRRERYANDRQFREKILASNRASYAANKDEILGRRRKRYEEDPDYRDKIDATKRRSADKCRKARNARARKRYADDPDYRERHRAARREVSGAGGGAGAPCKNVRPLISSMLSSPAGGRREKDAAPPAQFLTTSTEHFA